MLSFRSVGTLPAGSNGFQSPLPLAHPTEASVVLVGGSRASEHDSFNGACSAKIVTPPPGGEIISGSNSNNHSNQSWGGAAGPAAEVYIGGSSAFASRSLAVATEPPAVGSSAWPVP
ncbi:unnamed protein product [Ectocarpus fasciculatus]